MCQWGLDIDEAHTVYPLCGEHRGVVVERIARQCLHRVIPPDFHDADLAAANGSIRGWTPDAGSVYLFGYAGSGKSWDAAALAKRAWSIAWQRDGRAPRMLWCNVPSLMQDIADAHRNNARIPVMARLHDAEILVLDDLGKCDNTPSAVRRLYALMEHRFQHRSVSVTIITSNLNLDELTVHLGDESIISRIDGMCSQVSYVGLPDRRAAMAPRLE